MEVAKVQRNAGRENTGVGEVFHIDTAAIGGLMGEMSQADERPNSFRLNIGVVPLTKKARLRS